MLRIPFSRSLLTLALVFEAVVMQAQPPALVPDGILNAASRNPPSVFGGSIARGSRFEIGGVRLGATAGDVLVSLTQSQIKIAVPLITLEPKKIVALMPPNAPTGEVRLTVTREGESSRPSTIRVVPSSFGIFTQNDLGWGPARAGSTNGPVTFAQPARPGTVVTLSGTGLGDETHPAVMVAGRRAQVVRVTHRTQGSDRGLDEIAFRIPDNAAEGCFIPVYARAGTSSELRWVSNAVSLPIARSGSCKAPPYWPILPVDPGRTVGLLMFLRESTLSESQKKDSQASWTEHGMGAFLKAGGSTAAFSPIHLLPPTGSCTFAEGYLDSELLAAGMLQSELYENYGTMIDPGPALELKRPDLQRELSQRIDKPGVFHEVIGGTTDRARSLPQFLDPGEFTVSSRGGTDVGPFTAKVRALGDFQWTNRDQVSVVDRKKGVQLEWSDPGTSRMMIVFAVNVNRDTGASGKCVCVTTASQKHFFIDPDTLAAFPATSNHSGGLPTLIGLAAIDGDGPARFSAKGLDFGFASTIVVRMRETTFR